MVPPFGGSNPSAPAIFLYSLYFLGLLSPMRDIPKIKTLVIKIGSSVLSGDDLGINASRISAIAANVADLRKTVPNIIIVSSGAVAAGYRLLGFEKRPKEIVDKQASAAVGQARLIWTYEQEFEKHGIRAAQILLTKDDLSNRKRYLHARSALKRLLELGVIPIINENDVVLVDELKYIETFGDNDNLGALVAGIADADMFLIMSDVEGLYNDDPAKNKNAGIIRDVPYIDDKIMDAAGGSISGVGTGGMRSKLSAAKKALGAGCQVAIIKGMEPENLIKFFNGEPIGTYFYHSADSVKRKKFWIGYAAIPRGKVFVDDGALAALLSNKSLLAKGVLNVEGRFSAGDVVSVISSGGEEVARGKIRYSVSDMQKIKSKKSAEIYDILGYKISDEVIHRDDLIMTLEKY